VRGDTSAESGGDNAPDRILAAAAMLFAARGFDIPVREITTEAKVNGAAVNYHFGSKENLTEIRPHGLAYDFVQQIVW